MFEKTQQKIMRGDGSGALFLQKEGWQFLVGKVINPSPISNYGPTFIERLSTYVNNPPCFPTPPPTPTILTLEEVRGLQFPIGSP